MEISAISYQISVSLLHKCFYVYEGLGHEQIYFMFSSKRLSSEDFWARI